MARCGGGAVHFVLSVQREHDVQSARQPRVGLVPGLASSICMHHILFTNGCHLRP